MLFGLSRRAATEFSFFLAIPTLFAACALRGGARTAHLLAAADLPAFGVGFVAAFVSAFLCVRWLIRFVSHHDFTPFAWYRIAFGAVILVTAYTGSSPGIDEGGPVLAACCSSRSLGRAR